MWLPVGNEVHLSTDFEGNDIINLPPALRTIWFPGFFLGGGQGLSTKPRLSWNVQSSCLSFPGAVITERRTPLRLACSQ